MGRILRNIKGDKVIWTVVFLLTIISFLAVYSSTGTLAWKFKGGNTEYYMLKHAVILFFGLLLMYFAHMVKYTYYSRIFQIALYIAVPLLFITLIFGLNINEAKRVLQLPFDLTFQTSDLAKITLIIYLARMLTKKQENIKSFKEAFVPLMVPVLIVCGLIFPANFSTAAILFTTSMVLIFIGRVKLTYFFGMIGIGVVALAMALSILYFMPIEKQGRFGTWKSRITTFVDGSESTNNYQVEQAKIAIASGYPLGKGPGNSTQRNFLPHPYSDFIFAIIVEEYGFAGGFITIMLYLILFYRAIRIVTKAPGTFGSFLTIGVSFSLVFQAMINMGVAVNVLPVTGQPLPLISMGGTSIWFTSLAIGIILSVSRDLESENTLEPIIVEEDE